MHERVEQLHLINTIPFPLADIDIEQRHRFHNAAYGTWFAKETMDVQGRCLQEVWGEAYYEAVLPHIATALAGQKVTFESCLHHQGGAVRFLRSTYLPYAAGRGKDAGFFAVL